MIYYDCCVLATALAFIFITVGATKREGEGQVKSNPYKSWDRKGLSRAERWGGGAQQVLR